VRAANDDGFGAELTPGPAGSRQKATIQDVARAAGVGRQTVSNVLNGAGRVGAQTRARVLDAIAALDYQPHQGARSLRSQRTRQVAYMMPRDQLEPANLIMLQFLQSLAAAAARWRYGLLLVGPDADPLAEMRRLIGSRTVDGFVLSEVDSDDPRVRLLTETRTPFACFGRTGAGLPQHWVDIDNRLATELAVRHLVGTGRTELAYVGYQSASSWDADRLAGFQAGLASCDLAPEHAEVLLVDNASARRKIRALLTAPRPAAIVTSSDRLASAIYGVAAELRLGIGTDLAVTGFDGSVAASLLRPRLTSVAIPVQLIARRVLARALRQVGSGPDARPGEIVPARLRLAESTGLSGRASVTLDDRAIRHDHEDDSLWKRFHSTDQGSAGSAVDPGSAGSAVGARPKGDPLPGSRRITIADVAASAGVGVGTVSRVMNGSAQVTEATVRAVLDAADTLGYRPSHAAAALARGTPRTVAVLVCFLTRPSAVARVAGALAVLEQQGYGAIVCNVESAAERDRHLAALLPTHRADGVLAISLPLHGEMLAQFRRTGVQLVTVDAHAAGVPSVAIDDVAGGRIATTHLIELGHRRIGFIGDEASGPAAGLGFTSSARRLRGYRQALAAAGAEVDPSLIRRGPHAAGAAAELAAQLLKAAERPSAIFAASDTQAMGVLAAAEQLGVAVPDELSVMGFDDIESASLLGLSTVRQPLRRSGTEGARRLCALLRGEPVTPLRQELAVELAARSSSAEYRPPHAAGQPSRPGRRRAQTSRPS
jgi:DNA-binding LacI/PurR family transcriptional regulator